MDDCGKISFTNPAFDSKGRKEAIKLVSQDGTSSEYVQVKFVICLLMAGT